jgi:hypothetical protein
MNALKTTHDLDFLAAPWTHPLLPESVTDGVMAFIVGTCDEQYQLTKHGLEIVSVRNSVPGNGHLDDVFEWFEWSAKGNTQALYIRSFFNKRFKKHCIEKRGYTACGNNDVVKQWKEL